jgi:hypothetical protein
LVLAALGKDPEARPTAAELAAALRDLDVVIPDEVQPAWREGRELGEQLVRARSRRPVGGTAGRPAGHVATRGDADAVDGCNGMQAAPQ